MATIPTSIGPIGARQINHSLYVGQSDLQTIQSAVTAAAKMGGLFTVVIPFDYTGADAISAVTGGSTSIAIRDFRGGQSQTYIWNASRFIAERFQQSAGFVSTGYPDVFSQGSATYYFVPTEANGAGAGHIDIIANATKGMPNFTLTGQPSDGTPGFSFIGFTLTPTGGIPAAGIPQAEMPSQLGLFNDGFNHYNLWTGQAYLPGNKGMTVWAKAAENAIDFQGQTLGGAYDQAIRLNYLGGAIRLGPLVQVTANGSVTGITSLSATGQIVATGAITGASILAQSGNFTQTLQVDASPVRTFANTPDGGNGSGMVWPDAGVPVSLGNGWQTPSIDPSTLARTSMGNNFYGNNVFNGSWTVFNQEVDIAGPVIMGVQSSPNATVVQPNGALNSPAITVAGIPVVTDPTTIPRLNVANTFSAAQTINGNIGIAGDAFIAGISHLVNGHILIGERTQAILTGVPVICTDNTNLYFSSAANGFSYFNFDLGGKGVKFFDGSGAGTEVGSIDESGNADFAGQIESSNAAGNGVLIASNESINVANASLPMSRLQLGINGQTGSSYPGTFLFVTYAENSQSTAHTLGIMHRSPDLGQSPVIVGITRGGLAVNGNIDGTTLQISGTKAFRIPHPVHEEQDLVHACLEGPENGVYYRGEAETENGSVEIILPDYFESLTAQTSRTVLLTMLVNDDEPVFGGQIAAGRVKEGKFKVYSTDPAQKFYWEVKAVRSDIEPLDVEIDKETQIELRGRTADAITNRAGKIEDGELRTPSSHSATADTADTGRTRRADKSNRR